MSIQIGKWVYVKMNIKIKVVNILKWIYKHRIIFIDENKNE